jgi:hypothetical protein
MTRILTILFFLTFISCQDKHSVDKKTVVQTNSWELLKIRVDNKSFWVPANEDTCFYSLGTTGTNEIKKHDGKLKSDIHKIYMNKAQRDTIINIALHAITQPIQTDQQISDYAGQYVTISLEYLQTSISCKYSSISDWTRVSPTLKKLNDLTFGRTKGM